MSKFILVIFVILLSGCATSSRLNVTYQSEGTVYISPENFQFSYIKTKFDLRDQTGSQVGISGPTGLRVGGLETVIEGHLLKLGISTLTADEFLKLSEKQKEKCAVIEWGVSGRNSRSDQGAYSQEVSLVIRKLTSGELVYQGVGEYLGSTEIDDLKGALLAALAKFNKASKLP